MQQLYAKLFPSYKLEPLPKDHPLYSLNFPSRRIVPLQAVSNGVRLLAVHTNYDLPKTFQLNNRAAGLSDFEAGGQPVLLRHRQGHPAQPRRPALAPG